MMGSMNCQSIKFVWEDSHYDLQYNNRIQLRMIHECPKNLITSEQVSDQHKVLGGRC